MIIAMSRNAMQQARERGMTIMEIKRAIQRGAKHLQEKKIVADFMHIRVVYRKINETHHIITVILR